MAGTAANSLKRSAENSAAQPVEPAVCIITSNESIYTILTKPASNVEMFVALKTAVDQKPDLIVVSLGHIERSPAFQSVQAMTSDLMKALRVELAHLHKKGRAKPLVDHKCTSGIMCLFFTKPE